VRVDFKRVDLERLNHSVLQIASFHSQHLVIHYKTNLHKLSNSPSNNFRGFCPPLQLLGSQKIDVFALCSLNHHRFVFQLVPTVSPRPQTS